MANYTLYLGQKFDEDKCYTLSFSVVNYSSGDISLYLYNGSTLLANLGTYNADGDYTVDFDGALTAALLTANRLTFTTSGAFTLGNLRGIKINLDSSCVQNTLCSECYDYATCHVGAKLDIRYSNKETGLGFNYSIFGLTRQILVRGGLRQEDFPYPTEEYFTDSRGEQFPIFVYSKETVECWIEEAPAYIHQALRLAFVHDQVFINGKEYVKEPGSYSPDWDVPNSLLAPCVIKISEKVQNTYNDNC